MEKHQDATRKISTKVRYTATKLQRTSMEKQQQPAVSSNLNMCQRQSHTLTHTRKPVYIQRPKASACALARTRAE